MLSLTNLVSQTKVFALKNRFLFSLIVMAVFFALLAVGFFFWAGNKFEAVIIDQTLNRQQVVTRAGGKAIENFINHVGYSLTVLAISDEIKNPDENTQQILEEFISAWGKTPVVGVGLIDQDGFFRFIAERTQGGLEKDISVSDREYFLWAKTAPEGEVFVGKPILSRVGSFRGKHIIPLATPILKDGLFKGVLATTILVSDMTETYLKPLKISEKSELFLFNNEGVVLHAPHFQLIAENILDYIREHPFQGSDSLLRTLEKARELQEKDGTGKLVTAWPDFGGKTINPRLMSYSPVNIGKRSWVLAVASPVEESLLLGLDSFSSLHVLILLSLTLVIVAFILFTILAVRITQNNAFQAGFRLGKRIIKRSLKKLYK